MTKKGLIIINLGSPDSYQVNDVGAYLREFLMDERVLDVPVLWRHILVKALIVPFRAAKSAEAYKKIWTEQGSPLKVITDQFAQSVRQKVDMSVAVAMRYGNPSPAMALQELETKAGGPLDEILIAPMYPHYAMSSYETALVYMSDLIRSKRRNVKIRVLKPFYQESGYIAAMAASLEPYFKENEFDACLFSYHGLPVRHLKKADPTKSHCYASGDCCELQSIAWETCYKHQAKVTMKLITEKLNLERSKTLLSFQSRLGSEPWLQPFTDVMFQELPKKGIKKLLVLCPAFVADCLETLEEINIRGRESFLQNGGELFVNAPCLNASAGWVQTFAAWCNQYEGRYAGLWG